MPRRVRTIKRLLSRLLLAALLLFAPLLFWAGLPLLQGLGDDGSTQTEATPEAIADDAEWEACPEETRLASQSRFRARRSSGKSCRVSDRLTEQTQRNRFALVVDVRRIKPKRLFAPPYLRPRVVRLLS
jgi:hypothetical protein